MKNGTPLIVESPPPLPRRKVLTLMASLVTLTAGMGLAGVARADIAPTSTPVFNLLVVGDSLSAGYGLETGKGWVDLLRQRLKAKAPRWNVINASISGDTTAGGLARLPALLARDKPRVVIIELGGNDALRGLSLQQTQHNLSRMVALCKKTGARVLLVGMQIPPNYGPAYTARFEAVFPAVAKSQHVALVPFLLSGVVGHPDWFQSDNIHPTAQAQPAMLDTVWPYLAPLLALPAARSAP